MFDDLCDYANDPIEGLFQRLADDDHADKIDLGIGVFRDASGTVPVMRAVRRAEEQLCGRNLPKSYLSPLGNRDYCHDVERLVLGADHAVLRDARIVSAQTPGAGSALRVAAELVQGLSPRSAVWVSTPVWDHQVDFFARAGMQVRRYRYYDQVRATLDFDAMIADLRGMQANDLLLLHGCCHNPTGQDLTLDQWQAVAEVVMATGAVPFVDVAYQGFGEGIDKDVLGLQLIARSVPQLLLTVSSSKSFGIYRERAGLLSVIVSPRARDMESVRRKLRDTVRQLYFMAPDHGAAIVHEILSTPELEQLWRQELNAVREHVSAMRKSLRQSVEAANAGFDAGFIERQHGMFSCLPITVGEQQVLERRFHIYMLPNARVNVAAMNGRQAATLAEAFAFVRAARDAETRQATG